MAGTPNKKQQIAGELASDRMQLHDDLLLLRRDLDIRRHIIQSIRGYPWEWVTAGFIVGWLLSRLPARKKKIYIYSDNLEQVKRHRGKTLGKVWEVVWGTSKPLIAAYAAKKLAERIKNSHRRDDYERES